MSALESRISSAYWYVKETESYHGAIEVTRVEEQYAPTPTALFMDPEESKDLHLGHVSLSQTHHACIGNVPQAHPG